MRSLRSEYGKNVVPFCPTERCTVGLTIEETIEFEALDALPPFDDSGNIAWVFEGEPNRNFKVLIDKTSGVIFLNDYQV